MVTQWYRDKNPIRAAELMHSICRNLENPYIDRIHFIETLPLSNPWNELQPFCSVPHETFRNKTSFYRRLHTKARTASEDWSDRLTIGYALEFANKYLPGRIVIVANLDISFDNTLSMLRTDRWISLMNAYFLSRYEEHETNGLGTQCGPKYIGSHDSFVLMPPLPRKLIDTTLKLALGLPGVENRFMHEMRRLGMRVANPCLTIKSWHHHTSGTKNIYTLPLLNTKGRSGIARPTKLYHYPPSDYGLH